MQRGWARSAACLRVHGPDQQGIVRACSQLLDKFGCTIMESEQLPIQDYVIFIKGLSSIHQITATQMIE